MTQKKVQMRNLLMALSITVAAMPVGVGYAQEQNTLTPENTGIAKQALGPGSVADIASGLLDAVVNISISQRLDTGDGSEDIQPPIAPDGSPFQEYFQDFLNNKNENGESESSQKVESLGSGFVINAEKGFIVTNNHVIADADDIEVNFTDGSKLKAEIVGIDTKTDLAVLRIDPTKHTLTEVAFGDSSKARIGDWVMAVGNPFGLGGTVTVGIISARKRDINSGPYDSFIQTDAAINRGNSGGPLFDMSGKVIGINTAIISPSGGSIGIGFAIPAEMAINVISQLQEFGEVRRGWMGVRLQPVSDDMVAQFSLKDTKGAFVAGVIEGSGADNKALHIGDVIISIDDKIVEAARDLPRLVADMPVGHKPKITLMRDGKEMTVTVVLGQMTDIASAPDDDEQSDDAAELDENQSDTADEDLAQSEPEQIDSVTMLGMELTALDDDAREIFGIDSDIRGVVINDVFSNSPAAEKRIEPGEVIVDIGQQVVKTPEDVKKIIEDLRKEGRKNALLMLAARNGELRFVTVRID